MSCMKQGFSYNIACFAVLYTDLTGRMDESNLSIYHSVQGMFNPLLKFNCSFAMALWLDSKAVLAVLGSL